MLLKLFRVCPATTRDRLVDSPHWLFRPLSRFQGAPGGQKPPGTRRTRRPEPGGGGGALNPTQRFDPIGPAAGRVATLWRRCCSVKSGPGTREQGNTIYGAPVPQPPPSGFSSGVNLTSEEKVQGGSIPTQLNACSVDDQQMALPLALLEEDESTVNRRSGREGGHPIRHPLAIDTNPATSQRPSCITPR